MQIGMFSSVDNIEIIQYGKLKIHLNKSGERLILKKYFFFNQAFNRKRLTKKIHY